MAENQLTDQEVQQIEQLHRKLSDQPQLEGLAGVDICKIWQQVKPFWPLIVKAARFIPKVGEMVSEILRKIGDFLDQFCASGGGNG